MPSTQQFENNVSVKMVGDLTAIATTLTVQSGLGERFPSPTAGTYFLLTIEDMVTREREICRCTARTGDALTIVRAQEGSSALAFSEDTSIVQMRVTRDTLGGFSQLDSTETHTAGKWTSEVVPAIVTGVVTIDSSLSNCFYVQATEAITLAFTNGGSGQVINVTIQQDATGSRGISLSGGNWMLPAATAPTWSTDPLAVDMLSMRWVDALSKWLIVGIVGFAAGT